MILNREIGKETYVSSQTCTPCTCVPYAFPNNSAKQSWCVFFVKELQ